MIEMQCKFCDHTWMFKGVGDWYGRASCPKCKRKNKVGDSDEYLKKRVKKVDSSSQKESVDSTSLVEEKVKPKGSRKGFFVFMALVVGAFLLYKKIRQIREQYEEEVKNDEVE